MKKRAIWIFDKSYAVLTYVSVASFIEHVDIPVTLVYCHDELDADVRNIFSKLDAELELMNFHRDLGRWPADQHPHIINRLARFYFTAKYPDELVFIFDADMAFSSKIKGRIEELERQVAENPAKEPMIWGVKEHERAMSGLFFYFGKKDARGDYIKVPVSEKENTCRMVFGQDWRHLLSGPQFNNGLLAFYRCAGLIQAWKNYYLKGLEMLFVNPEDDQVPLSAAIRVRGCKSILLNEDWNSLGKRSGDYIAYHVYAGFWKKDVYRVHKGQKAKTDYGEIVEKFWNDIPPDGKNELMLKIQGKPVYYQEIDGHFDFGGVYDDVINSLPSGHLVEIGTYKGRSACYMAELIKNSGKAFRFDTIDHFQRADTDRKTVEKNLEEAGVKTFVNIVSLPSLEASELYEEDSLDFVFLDGDSKLDSFPKELEHWYNRLKTGGIMAGYDKSIHDTVNKGYHCAVDTFCKKMEIPLRTYKTRFFLQKPVK